MADVRKHRCCCRSQLQAKETRGTALRVCFDRGQAATLKQRVRTIIVIAAVGVMVAIASVVLIIVEVSHGETGALVAGPVATGAGGLCTALSMVLLYRFQRRQN